MYKIQKIINKNLLISKILCYFMPDFSRNYITTYQNMKKYLFFPALIVLAITFTTNTYSQQEAQFSHNMFNILSFNPAYAGSNDICLNLLARQQWIGFSETNPNTGATYNVSPQTFLFSIDAPIKPIRGGLGAVVYKDQLGHEDNIGLKVGYAYRRAIGSGYGSIGLQAGFLNKSINYAGFFPIDEGDPLLQGAKESDMIFDLSLGLFYKVPDNYFAGISTSQLLQAESDFSTSTALGSPKLKRHYYLIGGYQYTLPGNPDFELRPSLFIKTDFVSAQYDLNLNVWYQQKVYGGLSYRPVDAVVLLLGYFPTPNLGGGIAYDFTTSAMGSQGRSHGSAEIYIKYCFKIEIPPVVTSYKNVRFL